MLNNSIIMAYSYDITGDQKYVNGITETLDYIMGRNPIDKCYVSGYGENPMKYPHHRFYCPKADSSFPPVPPGFLSSGPNTGYNDPWMVPGLFQYGTAAMKYYIDDAEAWGVNSVGSCLNASLAWVTAYIDGLSWKTYEPTAVPTSVSGDKSPDVNRDGVINMADIMKVSSVFNTLREDERYSDKYDLNSDGAVNMADIMVIAAKFNTIVAN
jgi:endoglucanase